MSDRLVRDLIYDVGMHFGEDTAYYLAKGYRVVAFEANPRLVERARERFAGPLTEGRLEIIEGAIADRPGDVVTFYVHPTNSEWGTVREDWAARNAVHFGTSTAVTVAKVDFAATLHRTGVPFYMKVDVEGADAICVSSLRGFVNRPVYLSLEASKTSMSAVRAELALLASLGFDEFCIVQQENIGGRKISTTTREGRPLTYRFETSASGGFGEDLCRWVGLRRARFAYVGVFAMYALFGDRSLVRRTRFGNRAFSRVAEHLPVPLPGWYDTHARRRA